MEQRGQDRCVVVGEEPAFSRAALTRASLGARTGLAAAGLALVGLLVAQACIITRTADDGIRIEFAPDMVITAYGYEQALRGINDMIEHCLDGTFHRACTTAELRELDRAHNRIVKAKGRLYPG